MCKTSWKPSFQLVFRAFQLINAHCCEAGGIGANALHPVSILFPDTQNPQFLSQSGLLAVIEVKLLQFPVLQVLRQEVPDDVAVPPTI